MTLVSAERFDIQSQRPGFWRGFYDARRQYQAEERAERDGLALTDRIVTIIPIRRVA